MNLRAVGIVARLQVQRTRLKTGQKPYRVYDTSPLLSVQQLRVTSAGVVALLEDGREEIDVHHRDHPASQHAGKNGVSIGFATSYARMRRRFGDHVWDGCAGENILIETAAALTQTDLESGLVIRCGASNDDLRLDNILVALPCVEFSRYSLQLPRADGDSAEIKSALQFLDGGTRGYYTTPANHDEPLIVSVGDRVFLPQP